jgi:hypothetical protein
MAQVKVLRVKVTQNKLLATVSRVPQWEAHVLLAAWGDDAQIIGEDYDERPVPDINDEFKRLADKYGPKDEDTPYVAKVFGSFGPGLRALENEIRISVKGAAAPAPAPSIGERANAAGINIERTAEATVSSEAEEDFSEFTDEDEVAA